MRADDSPDGDGIMTRLQDWARIAMLVAVTFLATEWVHYRTNSSPFFERVFGLSSSVDESLLRSHGGPESVTEGEFQTYLRVLEAMQADHSLPIETAVATEHIPLDSFRDLEQRIQRNEVLIDRTRHQLREKAETLWNNARRAASGHG